MVFEFKFPDVGEGIHEGTIVKWHVKQGDFVKEDQALASIETDKAVVEIPSPKSGKILKINFKENDVIKVGEVLVVIEQTFEKSLIKRTLLEKAFRENEKSLQGKNENKLQKNNSSELSGKKEEREKPRGFAVVGELEEYQESLTKETTKAAAKLTHRILATPKVRALAKEKNVDLNNLNGSGKEGMILERDVLNSLQNKTSGIKVVKKYDFYGYVDRVPLKGLRKTIAEHMSLSYSKAVHVTHMDYADVTHLSEIREREKNKLEKEKIKLTYMPFIFKAITCALKEHPYLNSSIDEETQDILLKKYYNIGFAVDTEDGLIVPVIKRAESKKIKELAQEISYLSGLARDRKINLSDLKGGTFTITNIGSLGGMFATPIINYPEAAILALGKIQDQPLVINGKIEIRKVLYFSLSFDHRILDGAEAARFSNKIKEILEDPDSLLID